MWSRRCIYRWTCFSTHFVALHRCANRYHMTTTLRRRQIVKLLSSLRTLCVYFCNFESLRVPHQNRGIPTQHHNHAVKSDEVKRRDTLHSSSVLSASEVIITPVAACLKCVGWGLLNLRRVRKYIVDRTILGDNNASAGLYRLVFSSVSIDGPFSHPRRTVISQDLRLVKLTCGGPT